MIGTVVSFALDHWEWLAPLAGAPLAAIPFAGPILVFVKANWKWALPAVAFLALGVWAADRTIRVANLRAEIARGEAERAAAVLAQKNRDRDLARQIDADLDERNARTGAVVTTRTEVIYREKPVIQSLDTPAMRASDDGLLELGFHRATRPGAGQPQDHSAAP
ncbi:MAG: hypothetical protein FD144_4749 [Rhodospirillaceae bacterium]|nr:MAG: hypothetical protein FD144_4749 [Rhodospirillaceae bacterium]